MKDSQKFFIFHGISLVIAVILLIIAYINFDEKRTTIFQVTTGFGLLLLGMNLMIVANTYDQIMHEKKHNI